MAAVALCLATVAFGARADVNTDPIGEWLVAKKVARIKIADCGGTLWGVVAWEAKAGGIDRKNPDPKLQSRPTLGMPILLGMKPQKPNQWDGQIYNSQDGNTYSAHISLADPNTLKVEGCFLGFLCGGENWTRYDPNQDTSGAVQTQGQASRPAAGKSSRGQPQPVQTQGSQDVCLNLFGPSRLPHEGGLK